MKTALRVLFSLLVGASAPAMAEPWGWAEGPSGRTPLTDASVPPDATNIVFAAGTVAPGPLALSNRKLSFTAAAEGTTLAVGGAQSGFGLSGASGDWTFRGISFVGTGDCADMVYDGGAICCSGGRLTMENCTFGNVNSRFTGGAVSAHLMDGDVTASGCTFTGNVAGPLNGMGGALYCSRGSAGTGTLRLDGCTFRGNSAQNGGAVATVRVIDDFESPMPVEMSGCTFRGNTADYSGGAIDDEGDLLVENTLFADNGAAIQGGAICAGTSDPDWAGAGLTVLAGTEFRGNSATNALSDCRYWTAGGAISLAGGGYSLSVDGRHVVFAGNCAATPAGACGGAISAAEGTAASVSLAQFLANRAESAGGAVFSWGDECVITTSIFSNDTVTAGTGFGGAVAVETGAALVMSNSTVRGANGTAVLADRAPATLVNCVIADNGETDISVFGEGSSFTAAYTAYGTARVQVGSPVATNACLSGLGAETYRGGSLRLKSEEYNPVAALGLVQTALDHDGVAYGSMREGYSMGAFECPTPKDGPVIEIVSVTWYHDRAEGLNYPRMEIRFAGGDASRITGVTFACGGTDHELPAADVARLKTAVAGQVLSFGVDPSTFKQYPNSPANWGFVPPENRMFGVYDATRPVGFSVAVKGTLRISEVVPIAEGPRRTLAAARQRTVPVAARFSDFRAGERISGLVESATGARVWLFGCVALGADWQLVGEVETDGEGRFTAAVPEGLRFFRLEAEVDR